MRLLHLIPQLKTPKQKKRIFSIMSRITHTKRLKYIVSALIVLMVSTQVAQSTTPPQPNTTVHRGAGRR